MDEIVTSVSRVTDIMAQIMSAGAEQSAGIEQINRAIAQMDEGTQQNTFVGWALEPTRKLALRERPRGLESPPYGAQGPAT